MQGTGKEAAHPWSSPIFSGDSGTRAVECDPDGPVLLPIGCGTAAEFRKAVRDKGGRRLIAKDNLVVKLPRAPLVCYSAAGRPLGEELPHAPELLVPLIEDLLRGKNRKLVERAP